jgi:hypothetical protein
LWSVAENILNLSWSFGFVTGHYCHLHIMTITKSNLWSMVIRSRVYISLFVCLLDPGSVVIAFSRKPSAIFKLLYQAEDLVRIFDHFISFVSFLILRINSFLSDARENRERKPTHVALIPLVLQFS